MNKLRILALHGYHGSARVVESQLAGLASQLVDCAEFVAIDAPSLAQGGFGWWHSEAGGPGVHDVSPRY